MSPDDLVTVGALCLASALIIWSFLSGGRASEQRIDRRLQRIERALDRLERGEPPPQTPPGVAEARSLLEQGKRVEAVRAYRQQTGAGLLEAKEAVDAIERGERPLP